jgi:2-C-methyl-D-erythritol 4-phosphate cytidylyltransferase
LGAVPSSCDYVAVHDGARPFAPASLIARVISAAARVGAAIAAVRVKDTVKRAAKAETVEGTVPREDLWAAQTPQVFARATLLEAHRRAHAEGFQATDDAALIERMGGTPIALVEGSHDNLKITTPDDLELAQAIAQRVLATRR